MPYNEYRPMGNDTIGALTEADRVALRQQELAQALSRRSAPATSAGPKMNPLDFLLANALQQRVQAAPSNGGLVVGPGRGKSDVELANERAALSEARTAEEIARAKLMQTRQDIRENRPGIPGQSDGSASYVRGQSFPDFLPPQTAATFQDGQVVMAKPTPVEKDVMTLRGQDPRMGGDARAALVSMLQNAFAGNNPFAPQQSASKSRYEQLVGGPTQEPTNTAQRAQDDIRNQAIQDLRAQGKYREADAIARGGELPAGKQQTILPPETILEDLEKGITEFGASDTSLGFDPDDSDIENIVRLAMAADKALAASGDFPLQDVQEAVNLRVLNQLQPFARKWSGEWSKKLQAALKNRGQAMPFESPTDNPAMSRMPAYNFASAFGG